MANCSDKNKLLSLDDFNNYSGNFEDDAESKSLKTKILNTAQTVVEDYLGYYVLEGNYIEVMRGTGQNKMFVHNVPITYVNEVRKNNIPLDPESYIFTEDAVVLLHDRFEDNCDILIDYSAGRNQYNIPDIIRVTILRIATLLLMEAGENIGITSKSFSDNSRSFISYTNYDKYLQPLRNMRVFKL